MNTERLKALANWLEKGAPGIAFNMFSVRQPIGVELGTGGDPFDAEMIRRQMSEKSLAETDLCCGLDGATVQLFEPDFPLYSTENSFLTQDRALALLGLSRIDRGPQWDCAHDLFDPTHAPWGCSPEQAAQAVRRLCLGEEPWLVRSSPV